MKKQIAPLVAALAVLMLFLPGCGNLLKVGDVVQIGGYGWRVLEVRDGSALVLSEKILLTRAYHPAGGEISWAESDIRGYLNGEFYESAFTKKEKTWIQETSVENKSNAKYGTGAGENTVDRIFLLSAKEVETYIPEAENRIAQDVQTGETVLWWLRTPGKGKEYAADVSATGVVDLHGILVVQAGDNENTGLAGMAGDYASSVDGGVRPAMWIRFDRIK